MLSAYLKSIDISAMKSLRQELHGIQQGKCFICQKVMDIQLHADTLDVDHIEPLSVGGKDNQGNFALTHSTCNRSKQAVDLRVARVLSRFDAICEAASPDGSFPANLGHVLAHHGGSTHALPITRESNSVRFSFADIGDTAVTDTSLHRDALSGMNYFFALLPIAYLHHDDKINPRPIGRALRGLIEEFHRGNPQLHIGLGWLDLSRPGEAHRSRVCIFDGQHKVAAQVLLGVKTVPIRIFVNPNRDRLLTANTNAGTTLRQVAFDKSVQRRLGNTILVARVERFRTDTGREVDDFSFSESQLVKHFKGETNAVGRYVLDGVRHAITHHPDNKLRDYIEFAGKGGDRPFSYSSVEKTFYSFFIDQQMLQTPWDWRMEIDQNPREIEKRQIMRLMNIVADKIYINRFDPERGTNQIESKVQKGEDIPDQHLRAFRMAKEEILHGWLGSVNDVAKHYFINTGKLVGDGKLFQHTFPDTLWINIENFIRNMAKLPLWVDREMSLTVFGGKQSPSTWATVFRTGSSPQGQRVLAAPINLIEMIQP